MTVKSGRLGNSSDFSENDYDYEVLEKALENTGGPLKEWRKKKYQEYKEWGFPRWKRCNLDGMSLQNCLSSG